MEESDRGERERESELDRDRWTVRRENETVTWLNKRHVGPADSHIG